MTEWFEGLTTDNWIAIGVPVIVAVVGGIIAILLRKKSAPTPIGDIHAGIDGGTALDKLVRVSEEAGQSKNEVVHLQEEVRTHKARISQLEEELSQGRLIGDTAGQETPQPTEEAKELAKLITDDDGPYAQALKAIAEGNNAQADELLDETQQFLDEVQEEKDQAQIKIFMARMNNASYAGRPRDSLQWCDRLVPIAGDDSEILNNLGKAYYDNAAHQKAEPLMLRALAIDEESLGKDHPAVARDLTNLAQLYQDTNRLAEAEPLLERVVDILGDSDGDPMPNYAGALNNLAQLYQATNRLAEAEPLMLRALVIDEESLGKEHPDVARDLNNLAQLYKATNRLAEAEPLMIRALAIFETSLGSDHPDTITIRKNLDVLRSESN